MQLGKTTVLDLWKKRRSQLTELSAEVPSHGVVIVTVMLTKQVDTTRSLKSDVGPLALKHVLAFYSASGPKGRENVKEKQQS